MTTPRVALLSLVAVVLGLSAVLAGLSTALVLHFGSTAPTTTLPVVRNDFVALYAGARMALRGEPERAYDKPALYRLEKEITGDDQFPELSATYPPFFNLVMIPLARVDLVQAYRIWVIATMLAAIGVAMIISMHWHTVVLLVLFPAITFSASTGQNGNLSAALIGAGLLLLPRRPVWAGIAFGLMAYKPHLAVVIPFCLIAGRHFGALAAMGATAAASVLLSTAVFGILPHAAFVAALANHREVYLGGTSLGLWDRMPTVFVKLLQLTGNTQVAWTVHIAVAAGALAGVSHVWRATNRQALRALALLAATPLVTPYFFDYDLATLAVPLAFLLPCIRRNGLDHRAAALVAALWLAQPVLTLLPTSTYVFPILWIVLVAVAYRQASTSAEIQRPP